MNFVLKLWNNFLAWELPGSKISKPKYCLNCKQVVKPKGKLSAGWAIFWLIFGLGIGLLLYLIYASFQGYACPVCGDNNWRTEKK